MDSLKAKIETEQIDTLNTLVNIQIDGLPFSIVSVWLKAGSVNDPENKEGLAHFFEHLLMTKTTSYPDRISRLQHLAGLGIDFNAFTSHESVNYYLITKPKYIEEATKLLVDGLNNSLITTDDIEHEKNIILDEEGRNRNDPASYLWRLRQQALWPDRPLGRDFFGNEETIKSITLEDLTDFKQKFYDKGEKIWVIISGNLNPNLREVITISSTNKGEEGRQGELVPTTFPSPKKVLIDKRELEDISLGVYYRTVSIKDEVEVIKLNLLRELLTDNWTARLIERMRIKENLTYWVNGQTDNFSESGFIGFTFSTKKHLIKKSLEIIDEEIETLKKGSTAEELIDQTKEVYTSRLIQNHLTPHSLMEWYGLPSLYKTSIIDLLTYIETVNKITKKDLIETAIKYLTPDNRSIVTIGDIEEKDII